MKLEVMNRLKALRGALPATEAEWQLPLNINDLQKQKREAKDAARSIVDKATAENRDVNLEEQKHFDAHLAKIKEIDAKLDWHAANAHLPGEKPARRQRQNNVNPIPFNFQPGSPADGDSDALGEIAGFMRGEVLATSTPLHIQVSPVSGGLAAAVPTEVLDATTTYLNLDSFRLAGSTIYQTDSTIPLVKPILSAGPDTETFVEGQSATESHPFQADAFTFGGTKYSRLVRVSEEALMNTALDLTGSIVDELAVGVANTFTKAITTAMVSALQGNANCYVNSGRDPYHSLLGLTLAVPPRFDKPTNKFMLSRADLLVVKDSRDLNGKPLFDDETNQIFGHDYVINDSLTRVVYGDWSSGCYLRKTPFVLLPLRELYSANGEIGFKATQFLDQKFLASVPTVTVQPLFFTNLDAAGS